MNFARIYRKTTIADFAKFAGGKELDIAPTSIKVVSERYDIMEAENRAVGTVTPVIELI